MLTEILALEMVVMSKQTNDHIARRLKQQSQPFLDCVAHLLAKRWLHDQRKQEESAAHEQPSEEVAEDGWPPIFE